MAKTVSHAFDSAGYRNFRESRSRKQATRQVQIRGFRGFSDEMKPVFGEFAGRFDNTRRATRRKQANDVDGLLEILQEFNLHTFFELDPYDLRDGLYLIAFGICDFLYDTGRQDLIPDELNYRPSPFGGDSESYEYQMAQEYAEQYGYQEFPRYLELLNETLDAVDAEG